MDIGFCLPYMKNGLSRELVKEWCIRADQGPFSTLSCGERVTGPQEVMDMRVTLAFAAAITERVKIMPSLYVLPMHSAAMAAQEISTIDRLSNGRAQVCVGIGGREKDYQTVGASFKYRHQKMDDQIAEMKSIWQGNPVIEGADPVGMRPYQDGGPPILAGVMGPKAMARAAQWADGVYAWSMSGSADEIQRIYAMADAEWEKAGRTTAPRKVAGFWYCRSTDNPEQALKSYIKEYVTGSTGEKIAGLVAESAFMHTDEAIKKGIADMEALGSDELLLVPCTAEINELDAIEKILAE
tara:strand:- start:80 stop:970 length:891 start_codon:yes stop_codon:yes gene_type:complete